MNVGVAQVDITPDFEVELSGYAARQQPSLGVLDRIFVRALYTQESDQQLLWLVADVIAFPGAIVESFRQWVCGKWRLTTSQVLLSATHTHAAPATITLTGCGRCDDRFAALLEAALRRAADEAIARTEPARVKTAQARLDLAIDRRGMSTAHVDPIVTALGFVRRDGSFIAAMLNYAMHPVALSHENRHISSDWPGYASAALSRSLPGNPVVLASNGACGNINPPFQTTRADDVKKLGEQVAAAVTQPLREAPTHNAELSVRCCAVELMLETLSPPEIDAAAEKARSTGNLDPTWQHALAAAIDRWKQTVQTAPAGIAIDLLAARFGPMRMLAINGEMFSRFTALLREHVASPLFVVAYANAAFGYIPTREAYAEGGYEVDRAHFFYNSLRPRIGGLEMLAERAERLIKEL